MSSPSIRQAKLCDLARTIYVTKLAYKIPYREKTLITIPNEPKDLEIQFIKKEFGILIATKNNKIIGALRYKFIGKNNLYFYRLAVLKTFRRQGIGSALIAAVEKIAKQKHCEKILLDCAKEKKLVDYYEKFGFEIDKIKKHQDHHDVYMSKKLINF